MVFLDHRGFLLILTNIKQLQNHPHITIVFFKSLCTNPSFCYNSPNFQPNDLIFGDIRAVKKMYTKF